jgi:TonB family protein
MSKTSRLLGLIIVSILFVTWRLADEGILIQVRFFQGTWMGDKPGSQKVEVLSTSSHPEIASLKAMVDGPESELKVALIDALLDVMELRKVDDLFSFEKTWNGKDSSLSESVMKKPASAYRFDFIPKRPSPQTVSLQTLIYYKEIEVSLKAEKDPDKKLQRELRGVLATRRYKRLMEKIFERELVLEMGDPIIVAIPYESRAFFMMIVLRSDHRDLEQKAPAEAKEPEKAYKAYILEAPEPIHQLVPVYPAELRQQGVGGEVELQFVVDEKGDVQFVEVVKSLHPYLDYAAVQALKQWKFEPPLRKGKPAPGIFILKIHFNPETWSRYEETIESSEAPTDSRASAQEELRKILDRGAEYCRKLGGAALDFVCEETIKEIQYNIRAESITEQKKHWYRIVKRTKKAVIGVMWGSQQLWDPWGTEKKQYVCDYQLIRKGDLIKEQRIVLEENGRKITDQKKLLEEKRFSMLRPLFAAIRLLSKDRQPLFNYRILEEERVQGKEVCVIEAVPKFKDVGEVDYAKIWVDKMDFQILKTEIEGVPIEGFETILKEATQLNIKPESKITHHYQVEKKGILFPSSSKVRIAYPPLKPIQRFLHRMRLKIDMDYDKFKFFTVETDQEVKKDGT